MLMHLKVDTYSKYQYVSALSSEKAGSETAHLLEAMAFRKMSLQIKADDASKCVSGRIQQLFRHVA